MNRSLLILPVLFAIALGGWLLYTTTDQADSPPAAAPQFSSGEELHIPDSLPLLSQPSTPAHSLISAARGALGRPRLTLLARKATDGRELDRARAIIEPVDAETPILTVEVGATASSPTELDPGSWLVTFEAEGYVSQTRTVDLALGDEERLEVSLMRGALVTGSVQDRFGRKLSGGKLFFLAPGQVHPRFPREAVGILTTDIDREGKIEAVSVPPELYTITYGNLGTPKLKTEGRLDAGETAELLIVLGGRNSVRFELDTLPEESRRIEVRLEEQDTDRLARDAERLLTNPGRAAKLAQKNKKKERWRSRGQTRIKDGVGEIQRARPGLYRVTLLTRPGEYSSETLLQLGEDESVLVRIQTPPLRERSGPRKSDPKVPKDGPLNITILRDPESPEHKPDGIYWL
jgi:hypothetical protein